LIQAFEKLYIDIEFIENISKNAYEYCVQNFTYEARCKKILYFIKK